MSQAVSQLAQAQLRGQAKLKRVTDLVKRLQDNLETHVLSTTDQDALLEELKLYGRDPANSDPIFTSKGLETLCRYGVLSESKTTSRGALRVLANALLLREPTRNILLEIGYEPETGAIGDSFVAKAVGLMQTGEWEDEFLIGRILFLLTYGTKSRILDMVNQTPIADVVVERLSQHVRLVSEETSTEKANPMVGLSLVEILKLLFNLAHYCPDQVSKFTPAIPQVVALLSADPIRPSDPMGEPARSLVNAMLNLDLQDKATQDDLFPKDKPEKICQKLIELLDKATVQYGEEDLEQLATPLVGVLRILYSPAPEPAKAFIRSALLPTSEDRKSVLGQSESLPSRLLKNSSNIMMPQLKEHIMQLLFEVCDKDPTKFVNSIGYGYSSGYLMQNGIALPIGPQDTVTGSDGARAVNPITGQYVDQERPPSEPEMTEAEKEREAERLFVLFERLRTNGLISVENPMRTAVESGRVEELSDEEVD